MIKNKDVLDSKPQNEEALDQKPINNTVLDNKPLNRFEESTFVQERLYSLTLGRGMLIPIGAITYSEDQTILSPVSP